MLILIIIKQAYSMKAPNPYFIILCWFNPFNVSII